MIYEIGLTPKAKQMLAEIKDRRIQEKIRERMDGLKQDPEMQGKPLTGELAGLRSLRAVGQRYRILYHVEKNKVLVVVVALGLRKEGSRSDIYELAQRMIRLGLIKIV